MGMAPVAYALWQKRLNFDLASPTWPNRDRFILSAGYASMLLYALLHLTKTQPVNAEYETLGRPSVTLDDIKSFRQLGSACPGHPEYHLTSGAEAMTGPLGQGVATSVGLGRNAGSGTFNQPGFDVVDWHLRAMRRRLHDGRDFERGGLARRPSRCESASNFDPRIVNRFPVRTGPQLAAAVCHTRTVPTPFPWPD
jgi:hypothetical protein